MKNPGDSKFYNFTDLLNSKTAEKSADQQEEEATDGKALKFASINVVADPDIKEVKERIRKEIKADIDPKTEEERSEYFHYGTFTGLNRKERSPERGADYNLYKKDQEKEKSKKTNSIFTKLFKSNYPKRLLAKRFKNMKPEDTSRLLTYPGAAVINDNKIEKNDDIIDTPLMPEKKEPTNTQPEKKALSVEDLALQQDVYNEVKIWREILEQEEREVRKGSDEGEKLRIEEKMRIFEFNPYIWTKNALENKLHNLKQDFEDPNNKKYQKDITERLREVDARIEKLDKSFFKKIPLKLECNARTKDFRPDEGTVFNSPAAVKILSMYFKEKATEYVVGDAFQKGRFQHIILRTDTGVEKEISIDKLDNILNEAEEEEIKKLDILNKIEVDDTIEIRVGGYHGKESTYIIKDISGDKVSFYDPAKRQKGSMSRDDMKKFLFDQYTEFIVNKKNPKPNEAAENVTPSSVVEKAEPAVETSTAIDEQEAVADLEKIAEYNQLLEELEKIKQNKEKIRERIAELKGEPESISAPVELTTDIPKESEVGEPSIEPKGSDIENIANVPVPEKLEESLEDKKENIKKRRSEALKSIKPDEENPGLYVLKNEEFDLRNGIAELIEAIDQKYNAELDALKDENKG